VNRIERLRLFYSLKKKWKEETSHLSGDNSNNESYQKIIKMGNKALPFIRKELKIAPDWWFVALRKITGVNPSPKNHRGNLELMTKDWLEWFEAESRFCPDCGEQSLMKTSDTAHCTRPSCDFIGRVKLEKTEYDLWQEVAIEIANQLSLYEEANTDDSDIDEMLYDPDCETNPEDVEKSKKKMKFRSAERQAHEEDNAECVRAHLQMTRMLDKEHGKSAHLREALEEIRNTCGVILTYHTGYSHRLIEVYDMDKVDKIIDQVLKGEEKMNEFYEHSTHLDDKDGKGEEYLMTIESLKAERNKLKQVLNDKEFAYAELVCVLDTTEEQLKQAQADAAALRGALKESMDYILEENGCQNESESIPEHDCDYITNPEKGHCEFHCLWFGWKEKLQFTAGKNLLDRMEKLEKVVEFTNKHRESCIVEDDLFDALNALDELENK